MNWYLKVLKQYADFSGRARRKEYWMFSLFNTIFLIVALILDNVLGLTVGLPFNYIGYGVFYLLYTLAVFIPGLAVSVRRLHDVGKSGWMILIGLIPIIGVVGAIWLLVLTVLDSNPGENQYGSNPKEVTAGRVCMKCGKEIGWFGYLFTAYWLPEKKFLCNKCYKEKRQQIEEEKK